MKPSLQALWLVDDVNIDPNTGKVDLTGMFDHISVKWPETHYRVPACLFFALVGTHGPVDLQLVYVDLSDGSFLMEEAFALGEDDPLKTLIVGLHLRPIPVPHSGTYAWEVHWNNEIIGTSRVIAEVTETEGNEDA